MDQNVDLHKVLIAVQPTPSGDFSSADLIPTSGEGIVIPKQSDSPNPTIQIELTKDTPVNVVLITLLGKKTFPFAEIRDVTECLTFSSNENSAFAVIEILRI